MTDEAHDPSLPEREIALPAGIELERLASGDERVRVRYSIRCRVLGALPRFVLVLAALFAIAEAWQHRVFVFFGIFGLPLFRWLWGPSHGSLRIGERQLEIEAAGASGAALVVSRGSISGIEVVRAGLFRSFQRALRVTTSGRALPLWFVGLSAAQAEFLNDGLQRWLRESNA